MPLAGGCISLCEIQLTPPGRILDAQRETIVWDAYKSLS